MNRKRTIMFALLLLAGAAVFAFAGGQSESKTQGSAAPQVLKVAAQSWIFTKFPLEEVAKKFEADHPGTHIQLTRIDKWNAATYITDWSSGETQEDLFIGGTGSELAPVIAGGWLAPLDGMLTGNMASDKFVGGILADGHYKKPDGSGAYYPVLPFMGEVAILNVNTTLLKKAGLWENGAPMPIPGWKPLEFIGWFKKLGAVSPLGANVQIWDREFMQYDYLSGVKAMTGTFLAPDGKGFDVSSPAAHAWLSLLQQLYKANLGAWTTTDIDGFAKWKSNQAGSFFAAASHGTELLSVTKNPADLAYLDWPGADKNGSIIWTHAVWIPKVSKEIPLAEQFIREAVFSQYFQQWSFNHYGKLPALKAYYGDGITRLKADMPFILKVADSSSSIPLYKDYEQYLDILSKYLPAAAYGRMNVDQALAKIQAESANLDFTDIRAR